MSLCPLSAATARITIDECVPDRVVFHWHMDTFHVAGETHGHRTVSRLYTADANSQAVRADGSVAPAYTFCVGVPPGGAATVSIGETEVAVVDMPSPLPRISGADAAHQTARGAAGRWLVAQQPGRLGDLRTVTCRLCPFLYDSAGGVLWALRSARVTVRITGIGAAAGTRPRSTHFDPVLRRVVLNYDIAHAWRTPGPSKALRASQRAACPVPARGRALAFAVGDGHSGLNEGTTDENGLVRISGADVARVLGEGIAIDRVALLAGAKGELSRSRPDAAEGAPLHLIRIPLLRFDADRDGRLDNDDSFVAWVTGGSDWHFDTAVSTFSYRLNRYDDYRRYWLVYDADNALTMDTAALGTLRPERAIDHFTDRLYIKRSRMLPGDGREATLDWVWEKLSSVKPTGSYTVPVIDPDPDSTGRLRVLLERVTGTGGFSMRFGGKDVCRTCTRSQWYEVSSWQDATVEVRYEGSGGADAGMEIEHFELEYNRRIDMAGRDRMTLFSPAGTGTVEYTLSGVPPDERVYLIRVPRDETGIALVDTIRTDAGAYTWVDSAGLGIRYHIATEAGFQPAPMVEPYKSANAGAYGVTDLRGGDECDYLIIYHDQFIEQADRLAAHKERCGRFSDPRIVDIADVYREFSGGHLDPTAVRNFIWHAKRFWPACERLSYVVLMGLGHYDSRQVAIREPVFIPVNIESTRDCRCAEQYFVGDSADALCGPLPLACEIVVTDPNGIDVLGSGPDEGLTVEIPGVLGKRSINHAFQFTEGDYREGAAPFVLGEGQLQPGAYRMTIGARDLLENYSRLTVDLEIIAATELRLDHVFNYPNPMRMRETTRFYYNLPQSPYMPASGLVLRIYTLPGKLIRTVQQPENGYEWDGTDQLGNTLSPNVYLYQFVGWNSMAASEPVASAIRRLVIHPPR